MVKLRSESVLNKYPIDESALKRMILDDGLPRWIASMNLGVPVHAVDEWCRYLGLRSGKQPSRKRYDIDLISGTLISLHEVGKTHQEIGIALGINPKQVYEILKRLGVPSRRRGPKSGEGHPDWNGGKHLDSDGYVLVWKPGHPMARKCGLDREPTYVPEHRLVMSEHLGRILKDDEVVHHRNGDKADNRIENLELFESNSQHLKHELTGHCPEWTEDGKRRIREGLLRRWQRSTHSDLEEDAQMSRK